MCVKYMTLVDVWEMITALSVWETIEKLLYMRFNGFLLKKTDDSYLMVEWSIWELLENFQWKWIKNDFLNNLWKDRFFPKDGFFYKFALVGIIHIIYFILKVQ